MTKTDEIEETGTALVLPKGMTIAQAFGQPKVIDAALEKIANEVRAHVPDTSTAKGRDEIASIAFKVARSKTAMDKAGMALTEEARKSIDAVNAERRKIREFLDELKAEVREPLTKWEEAEKKREELAEFTVNEIRLAVRQPADASSAQIAAALEYVRKFDVGPKLGDRSGEAQLLQANAVQELERLAGVVRQREAEAEELAKLRAEQAERAAREAEEQRKRDEAEAHAAREKAEAAAAAAREKAEAERREQVEREKAEAAKKAAAEADARAKREAEEAEKRHAQALADAEAAKQQAVADAKAKARADAIRAEHLRQAKIAAEKEEAEKRARNQKRRAEVKAAIAKALDGLSGEAAAEALMAGSVPHVEVRF